MRQTLTGLVAVMMLVVIARLLPHPVNVSPFGACLLLVGLHAPRYCMVAWVVLTVLISDACLALLHGWPYFGWWTLFNGVAYFMNGTLLAPLIAYRWRWLVCIAGSINFWVVSNFGVWLTSSFYETNWQGLMECYTAALPFFTSSCLGDLGWFCLLYGLLAKASFRSTSYGLPQLRFLQS